MSALEAKCRRRARALGYRITKSNWRRDSIDNQGGFMIVENDRNLCVAGNRYELDIEAVDELLSEWEAA
ncbi:conserved hypothetical protein [Mesorhizobium plurifarium]|uniref:Uncharacterized protein n=1 Tax=Mesorhizobium plurifarium TaxID=69974 RepID=A0A090DYE0_MESPL|nr:conserved hypothetical protein [Mesorhizobium plurifarium]